VGIDVVTVVLGVDGGGTKTHAAIAAEDGTLLGLGRSGPSNWEDVGIDGAAAALKAAVREAFGNALVEPDAIASTVFGLAGVDFPSDEEKMSGIPLALGIHTPCRILNDSFAALRAGANHPWGVVVIAGTGSVVAGRNPAGETARTLGLGPMFGDFGSGTDVSAEAIMAVAAQLTGQGPRTLLTERLCEVTDAASPMAFIEGVARGSIPDSGFASTVVEAGDAGDLAARRILEHAGSSLGDAAGHVARRLSMDGSEFEIVLTGGMFRNDSRLLTSAFEYTVKRHARFARPVRLEVPPVVGAVLLGFELIDLPTDPDLHMRLAVACNDALRERDG
jgi:N-acetylglucosamine kinase-like BadF-type ATPase